MGGSRAPGASESIFCATTSFLFAAEPEKGSLHRPTPSRRWMASAIKRVSRKTCSMFLLFTTLTRPTADVAWNKLLKNFKPDIYARDGCIYNHPQL
ncbi:uncharacterized protein PITG_13942 [Phytophthora infestans T30-4]|uniref:Uncharacterized protein n=1 Tax=Phytophthora infestans (strain T30-4) TaxID=403677 RepID=D0NN58_PHYIT|nr:uncharacterized protein PITG_13942 [Phytophthora infestans T30-4]EEY61965.1 hypothetical protein PITG_13942 [Phytophthora infestans T30-4]|eukprot:XP_002899605.1 hypothetical protein PITG_13942 [Phytophthora infestans T30-4]